MHLQIFRNCIDISLTGGSGTVTPVEPAGPVAPTELPAEEPAEEALVEATGEAPEVR